MKTTRKIAAALLAVAAMGSMLVAGNGPASAGEAAAERAANPEVFGVPLNELLADHPNAERRADGSYLLEPGVRLLPPGWVSNDAGVMEPPSGCPDRHFCLYQHAGFGGWGVAYYYCLEPGDRYYPPSNQVSSMHNAQNSPTAYFWDDSPYVQGTLGPNRYWGDLSRVWATDGRTWNDRIDRADAC